MKKLWVIGAVLLLVVGGMAAAAFGIRYMAPPELHGTVLDPPLPAEDFVLTSNAGPVRLSDHRDKLVVLFFGYTFCPDVCPTTMVRLGNAMHLLDEKDAAKIQVIMVSVDPERDTPERLESYVKAFHPSFIGATGTEEEIAEVASKFGIYHAKAAGSAATGYLVDHSATVLVLGKDGSVRLMWPFEVSAEDMAADLRALVRI